MYKSIFVLLFLSTLTPAYADGRLGLGVILGDPTAITIEQELDAKHSIDAGFGYSWRHSVVLYGDYLFRFPGAFSESSLEPYVGVGPELRFYDSGHRRRIGSNLASTAVSARFPLGLAWHIPDSAFKVFAELVPVMNIIPGLDADFGGGIGFRAFF